MFTTFPRRAISFFMPHDKIFRFWPKKFARPSPQFYTIIERYTAQSERKKMKIWRRQAWRVWRMQNANGVDNALFLSTWCTILMIKIYTKFKKLKIKIYTLAKKKCSFKSLKTFRQCVSFFLYVHFLIFKKSFHEWFLNRIYFI